MIQEINVIFIGSSKARIGQSIVVEVPLAKKTKVSKLIDGALLKNPYVARKWGPAGVEVFKLLMARHASKITPEFLARVQLDGQHEEPSTKEQSATKRLGARIQLDGQDPFTQAQLATKRLDATEFLANAGPWADSDVDILMQVGLGTGMGDPSDSDSSEQGIKRRFTNGGGSADERQDGHSKRLRPGQKEFAVVDNTTARREHTVNALYNKLKIHHFIAVRGTPGSGKSTLAELLARRIKEIDPKAIVIRQGLWEKYEAPVTWLDRLRPKGYDAESKRDNYLIFDDGQTTYWDMDLWNDLCKSFTASSQHYIIMFVSYGSQGQRLNTEPTPATPEVFPTPRRIGLRHPSNEDDPVGLLLTQEEFQQVLAKKDRDGPLFSPDFLKWLESVTGGHVGAVEVLITGIRMHASYTSLRHQKDRKYYISDFQTISHEDFWKLLSNYGSAFGRGLPAIEKLQNPQIARVFRAVLVNHHVTETELPEEARPALDTCFKMGWLHAATRNERDKSPIKYVFASPLHQLYVEHVLGHEMPGSAKIKDRSLLDFVINVIKQFSHVKLKGRGRLGASEIQRPPEAQYQDEFYRACHTYTEGSLMTFPEFGGTYGKIDFYIPGKSWGVEVLRDGNRLEQHVSRFLKGGSYAGMSFKDFILLDFRSAPPILPHSEMFKLYHVVFDGNYEQVQILRATTLEVISHFALFK